MICEDALPEHVAIYSTGDSTVLFDEKWLNFAIEKCDEDARIEDKEVFLQKIESGEVEVNKIGFMIFEPSIAEEIQFLLSKAAKKYNMECTRSNINFIEYMPPNTNKGTGLAQLNEYLNIKKEEIIAFGDGGNDIELLQNAGWSVAMENANEKLKSIAKFVTKSNSEDGVVDVLEKIFLRDEQMN
ncbi:hypothetical protein BCR36DRAFT_585355 [Piromyces finnis]|uniref:HAD-like protein n=1 Tax=Piromyces finnis TaxID=1754191 RepID=A0A1Y1V355_9FUNG|nr:hypothetical protein BCR36DRAFT_585355 [Piromyces finnis]|eukprot:ORX46210.1 hypothetical protein BCR36DRAFT_585355 [Piromyces finnis]